MKTMNNVRKTAVSPLIIILSLILGTLYVNAQKLERRGLHLVESNQLALVTANNSNGNATLPVLADTRSYSEFAAYLEPAIEEPLEMENWMISDKASDNPESPFNQKENVVDELKNEINNAILIAIYLTDEKETPLELENWMTDVNHFNKQQDYTAKNEQAKKKW